MDMLPLADYLRHCRHGIDDRLRHAEDHMFVPNPPTGDQELEAYMDGYRAHGRLLRSPAVKSLWRQVQELIGRKAPEA